PNNSFTFVHPKYNEPTFTVNRFGFRSTREHDVETVAKPPGTLRIATFGGSTTMGTNNDSEVWPYLTGRKVSHRVPGRKIEVLNEGLMGYTTLDNLIDLAIRVIDFDSDVYILYFGVNDYTAAAPLDVYKSDHSHYRRTLYETIGFSAAEVVPRWLTKSQVMTAVFHAMGMANRQSLAECTGTAMFRDQDAFTGFEDDEINEMVTRDVIRNLISMIGIIRAHNPDAIVVLSSFYDRRQRGYIKHLNPAFQEYAAGHDVLFVDVAGQLPYDRRITFDDVHFTPEGAELVSDLFAEAIARALATP
ncbi:MAG: SGNH/GDSL hydrolase family protein, partial [Planctomycetota bacterium]